MENGILSVTMIDKKEFVRIRKRMAESEEKRESVIQLSREIIQLSKLIIYAIHRDEASKAKPQIEKITKLKSRLESLGSGADTDIDRVAMQEYAEAVTYHSFASSGKIPNPSDIGISDEHYLLGLCDLTGELARRAVALAIRKDFDGVRSIKTLIEEIFGEFLQFNLRNSELRKKSDQIKWNLKKVEDIMYEANMKGMA